METLQHALDRLEALGFRASLHVTPEGFLPDGKGPPIAPEELVVEETVRFEGESNPEDQAVLFALRSRDDRIRGTLVSNFGINADPVAAELIRRLQEERG